MEQRKIGELKKMLREIRAKECPPISKMRKAQVVDEISRVQKGFEEKKESVRDKSMKQLRQVEAETKARNVGRKQETAEKIVKKIEEEAKKAPKEKKVVRSMAIALEEKVKEQKKEEPKKLMRAKKDAEVESVSDVEDSKPKKFAKGSAEAKEHMARIRGMRAKKD